MTDTIFSARQRLSANMRWMRFIVLALAVFFLYSLAQDGFSGRDNVESMTDHLIVLFFCCLHIVFYIVFDRSKVLEFDAGFLYVKSKNGEEKVALSSIHIIRLSSIRLGYIRLWELVYLDEMNNSKSVSFQPLDRQVFSRFQEMVKIANPVVQINRFRFL
ncbi:MAG: hypothetical protein EOP56_12215 [Sphingobacteriales bacterium]|nr:MAG: hypothetical protein EOP56_12215 [Sphingobacteriales bacterium]